MSVDVHADLNGNGIPDFLEAGNGDWGDIVNPGKVPWLVLMVLFASSFSIIGYSIQWITLGIVGDLFSPLIVAPVSLAASLPFVSFGSRKLSLILPRDETNAVTIDSLIGKGGVVNTGPINNTEFGFARFTDDHGVDHNICVIGEDEENIDNGSKVVLLRPYHQNDHVYVVKAI